MLFSCHHHLQKNLFDYQFVSLFSCFFILFIYLFSLCRVDMDAQEGNKSETDERFWEVLMSADKKDYESICVQYGVTDFRGMLKKLNEKKIEREKEQEKVFFSYPVLMGTRHME